MEPLYFNAQKTTKKHRLLQNSSLHQPNVHVGGRNAPQWANYGKLCVLAPWQCNSITRVQSKQRVYITGLKSKHIITTFLVPYLTIIDAFLLEKILVKLGHWGCISVVIKQVYASTVHLLYLSICSCSGFKLETTLPDQTWQWTIDFSWNPQLSKIVFYQWENQWFTKF